MNPERLLENNGLPFAATLLVDDHRGFEQAVVVARLAWQLDPSGAARIASPQRPIRVVPQYRDGPNSSLRFASDAVCDKPGTEIIMLAKAWPRPDKRSDHVDVSLQVETGHQSLRKVVRAYGARRFEKKVRGVAVGPAAPLLEPAAIVYEQAAGGCYAAPGGQPPQCDEVNPVGIGFVMDQRTLVGQDAFTIESLVGRAPAGFGPIARHWSPRRQLYGNTDDKYMRSRHPVPPEDFDVRYNIDAHPDLWSETPMRGDEPFEIIGATPEGAWRFRLPYYEPRFDVTLDGEEKRCASKLDTILIDIETPRERIVELTWRAAVRLPKRSERLAKIRLTNAVDLPRRYYDILLGNHQRDSHQELH